ncbi:MAG TPA: branched-chain amino acid ABC transporter ATP-binding protein/permease [Trebonia sp.]
MQEAFSYIDQILVFLIFGLATNLIFGYAGVLQAAPAAFGAFGGYAVLYLTSVHHVSWILTVLIGMALALVAGFVIGLPALQLDGVWVLLLTLAASLVIGSVLSGLTTFGGDNGLQASSSFTIGGYKFDEPSQLLPLAIVVAAVTLVICWRIGESAYGRVLRGIRADESAVAALGKNVYSYKLAIFSVTAVLAALAGAMLATLTRVATPSQYSFSSSIEVIAIVIIGGVASPLGTVLGSTIVVLLTPLFQYTINVAPQTATNWQLVAYGLVLTVVVLFRPSGLIPEGARFGVAYRRARGALFRAPMGPAEAAEAPAGRAVHAEPGRPRPPGRAATAVPARAARPAAEREVVVDVRNVSKSFAGIKAVNGLSMQLEAGKITALIGANGAGKTTVFNLLTGALPVDSGEVYLNGEDITGLRPDQVTGRGLVRSFQDVRLFSGMTVLDNVLLGVPGQAGEHLVPLFSRFRATRAKEREATQVARYWLEYVGMGRSADTQVDALGYAQQKLVSLARILATDAQVLLLDEPASGIDYQFLDEILGVISRLRDEGRTVCIVEHNLDVVRRLADHVYFMEVGAVTAEGSINDLTSDPRLAEVYFGGGGSQ